VTKYQHSYDEKEGIDRLEDPKTGTGIAVRRLGGELISYRILDPRTRAVMPVLYRDGLAQAEEGKWKNHATVLFPFVGGLKNKTSLYRNRIRISTKGNHGFARHSAFIPEKMELGPDAAWLRYALNPNPEIEGYYPFRFRLCVTYTVRRNDLNVEFIVENKEKDRTLPYSLGWHPGFRAPILDGKGTKGDCRLLLSKGDYIHYECNSESRLTGKRAAMKLDGAYAWTEDDLHQTIMLEIGRKRNRQVVFHDPHAGLKLKVRFPAFPFVGFWANRGENYICIEPWQGLDDHEEQEPFEDKVGLVELKPGGVDKRKIEVIPEFERKKR